MMALDAVQSSGLDRRSRECRFVDRFHSGEHFAFLGAEWLAFAALVLQPNKG
jgi:hypothetical protein